MTESMKRVLCISLGCMALFAATSVSAAKRVFSTTTMAGGREVPPVASTANGSCTATLDDQSGVVSFSGTFTSLSASAIGAHLAGPASEGAGRAPIIAPATTFTIGTSGTFLGTATLTTATR